MASKEHDFSVGSIPRNIISLALPMTAAQLINVLYSVVDRIYLGRLPGHLALTGLGLTLPIMQGDYPAVQIMIERTESL